jgi:hypothetical protein
MALFKKQSLCMSQGVIEGREKYINRIVVLKGHASRIAEKNQGAQKLRIN